MSLFPCRQLGGTTWRSVGSAHSFASASLGCGTPCGRTLWRCRGTWRLLVKKKKNTECKWWKMIRVRSDSSRRRKRKRKKKSLTWFFWTVKTSFIWNLWAEELWVRKKAAVKGAEAPWSFALSTLRILSLYFSCGHGNRWIHRHDKSSWSLLCPMRAPRPG